VPKSISFVDGAICSHPLTCTPYSPSYRYRPSASVASRLHNVLAGHGTDTGTAQLAPPPRAKHRHITAVFARSQGPPGPPTPDSTEPQTPNIVEKQADRITSGA
jgi:hypothetical protein